MTNDSKAEKPLFVPLKAEFYSAFVDGSKTIELRKHGQRWNATTCRIGRPVTISKGYGKRHRRSGVITSFAVGRTDYLRRDWIRVYGVQPCESARIGITLDVPELLQTPLFGAAGVIARMADCLAANFPRGRSYWRVREAMELLVRAGFGEANPARIRVAAIDNGWTINCLGFLCRPVPGGGKDARPASTN